MRDTRAIFWIGVTVLCALFFFLILRDSSSALTPVTNTSDTDSSEYQYEYGKFGRRIEEAGAKQAYEEFKQEYAPLGFSAHPLAHIFGKALYDKGGIHAVAICDSSFSFGCHHGFFIKTIHKEGLEAISNLSRACMKVGGANNEACQHGIGHGILQELGKEKLLEALEVCENLPGQKPIGGCSFGVFTEYHTPPNLNPSEMPPEDPYHPCPLVAQKFQQACHYELARWWHKKFDDLQTGLLCNKVSQYENRVACYLGMGSRVVAPSTRFIVEDSIGRCQRMPTQEGEILCRAGAVWAFRSQSSFPELASRVCVGLASHEKDLCLSEARVFEREYTEHTEWIEEIEKLGPESTYKLFKQKYEGASLGEAHIVAHAFGGILYKKTGAAGITVCDNAFGYGCYHGFFSGAITDKGLDIIFELDKACTQKYEGVTLGVGCSHGIGHGIVEYLGKQRFADALNLCAQLSWQKPFGGCALGVFMEHTAPPSLNPSQQSGFDAQNPYSPCPAIEERFQRACYYELGKWWYHFMEPQNMGSLCKSIDQYRLKEACYLGIGSRVSTAASNFDVAKAIGMCRYMPTREGEILCRAGAAWAFRSQSESPHVANDLCVGLDTPEQERLCLQKSDIFGVENY